MNKPEPKCGQTYVFQIDAFLPNGFLIRKGDKLLLIEPTGQNPHGWFDHKTGHNWLCKGPNGVTVWSTIPWGIKMGYLVLEESDERKANQG